MASAIFQEIRSSATGALDKARLVLNPEAAAAADQNADEQQQQQPDRLEELAEYCPKLSFQQVGNPEKIAVSSFFFRCTELVSSFSFVPPAAHWICNMLLAGM
jgi:hypothetical protein